MPEYEYLRPLVSNPANAYSVISRIEVLGYKDLSPANKKYFQSVFAVLNEIPLSKEIADKAIEIKQAKATKLGDAIIAATGLTNNLKVLTRNISDFKNIGGLEVENPIH